MAREQHRLRRIEGDFARGGRCTIEARLVAVEPFVDDPPNELVRGHGRTAGPGDRVRIRYALYLREGVGSGALVATSGETGISFTVGAGELEPVFDRVVVGMRVGGSRTAVLAPRDEVPERWLWLDLLDIV